MKYVSFEGIDGAGKTTQIEKQYYRLQKEGISVGKYEYTKKNNFWGKIIREVYSLDTQHSLQYLFKPRIVQETLYALSARNNLKECDLNKKLILSDRSIVTAYASHIHKIPEWFILLVEPSFIPNLVIYLDISPEVGLERIKERNEKFRDEDLESLIEFRDLYMELMFDKRPKILKNTEFVVIDAIKSLEEVTFEVTELFDKFI